MDVIFLIKQIALEIQKSGGTCYYVGGFVRDRLMGRDNDDIDIEVHDIGPERLFEILSSFGPAYSKGSFFGIYAIKGYSVDFALPRSEKAYGNGHKDFEIFTDTHLSINDSARRRDFTINSIYENVITHEIIDCYGGREDIKSGIIRHIDPVSFAEDPLRVLRAAQFAARFCFKVSKDTEEICRKIDLSSLSKERIDEELNKALLKSQRPSVFFNTLMEMDAMDIWFPEIKALCGIEQNPKHHPEGDAYVHTMSVVDKAASVKQKASDRYSFMLSALCHDLGKSLCTAPGKDGCLHSYGHEEKGVAVAGKFISRITGNKEIKRYVLNMVLNHMRPNKCAEVCSSVKKTNHVFDESVCPDDLLLLAECDALSAMPEDKYAPAKTFLNERLETYKEYMAKPYVTGKDLCEAGISPGEKFHDGLIYAHKLRLAGIPKEEALKQTISYIGKIKY